jgi:hypothetical protein
MTQRWFLLIHGKVQETTVDRYLIEAKRGQWIGITRKDGTEPTWDDFNALFGRSFDVEPPSPTEHPPTAKSVTDQPLEAAL